MSQLHPKQARALFKAGRAAQSGTSGAQTKACRKFMNMAKHASTEKCKVLAMVFYQGTQLPRTMSTYREENPNGLAGRAKMAALVRERAEDGRICVVTSGRDCDGVQWSGAVYEMAALPRLVERFMDDQYDNAEGPLSCGIVSPSQAREIQYHSRDLVAEAYEDGHPHVIYT